MAEVLPEFFIDWIGYAFAEMEYLPQGWSAEARGIKGWSEEGVAAAQEEHWPTLVRNLQGTGPLGVWHFPWSMTREDRSAHNAMMSFGYVLALAAREKDRLSMLDWGGGAGHHYLYCNALLPEVKIEYHCYDLPQMCRLGRRLLPQVQFHDNEACLRERYDLVVSSSSLHYFEDWHNTVRRLADATGEFLYVARLQTVSKAQSFVTVHRPNRSGYTQFVSWCLNRAEFVRCVEESGLQLVREFVFAEKWYIKGAPEKGEGRGFLFHRRRAGQR